MAPRTELDKALASRTHAEARVAILRARGESIASVAARLGVDRSYVSRVNAGTKRGPAAKRVEREIARAMNMPVRDAFPERDHDSRVA